ncbi:hypothetical protein LTR17_005269 [Elasticomyces elasticus]|nr:hypothetical protein LTR17_005269 [Elasticomyces elasticus]
MNDSSLHGYGRAIPDSRTPTPPSLAHATATPLAEGWAVLDESTSDTQPATTFGDHSPVYIPSTPLLTSAMSDLTIDHANDEHIILHHDNEVQYRDDGFPPGGQLERLQAKRDHLMSIARQLADTQLQYLEDIDEHVDQLLALKAEITALTGKVREKEMAHAAACRAHQHRVSHVSRRDARASVLPARDRRPQGTHPGSQLSSTTKSEPQSLTATTESCSSDQCSNSGNASPTTPNNTPIAGNENATNVPDPNEQVVAAVQIHPAGRYFAYSQLHSDVNVFPSLAGFTDSERASMNMVVAHVHIIIMRTYDVRMKDSDFRALRGELWSWLRRVGGSSDEHSQSQTDLRTSLKVILEVHGPGIKGKMQGALLLMGPEGGN